jgi:hypothetical protein
MCVCVDVHRRSKFTEGGEEEKGKEKRGEKEGEKRGGRELHSGAAVAVAARPPYRGASPATKAEHKRKKGRERERKEREKRERRERREKRERRERGREKKEKRERKREKRKERKKEREEGKPGVGDDEGAAALAHLPSPRTCCTLAAHSQSHSRSLLRCACAPRKFWQHSGRGTWPLFFFGGGGGGE